MVTSGWAASNGIGFLSSVPGLVDSGLKDANDDGGSDNTNDVTNTNDDSGGDDNTIKFGFWSGQQ